MHKTRDVETIIYHLEDNFNYSGDSEANTHRLIIRYNKDPSTEIVWDPTRSIVNLTTAVVDVAGLLYVKGLRMEIYHSWRMRFIVYMGDGSSGCPCIIFMGARCTGFSLNRLISVGGSSGAASAAATGAALQGIIAVTGHIMPWRPTIPLLSPRNI